MTKKILVRISLTFSVAILILCVIWSRGKVDVIFKNAPAPVISHEYVPSILLPQDHRNKKIGSGSGIAVDSKGYVFYLHRAGYTFNNDEIIPEPTILQLNTNTGEVIAEWGKGVFKSPHGLSIDFEDNVWVTDIMLNKVFKFSHDGKLLKTFGEDYPFFLETSFRIKNVLPKFPSTNNPYIFARPTDVVVNEKGEFVVTDGYRNKRIAKFNRDGELLWEINKPGSGPGELNLPHGIALDQQGRLYVADRGNARIQVFSSEGKWLATWDQAELGRPFGLEIGTDGFLYMVDGGDLLHGRDIDPRSQIVKMDLNGNLISRWGTWGDKPGELKIPHDIAVDGSGNLYVAELNNNRLQKFMVMRFTPHPK
ncbi:MAG: peptidyl-alpha-hydroxyglycine alpha-amidating lyase family protein [Clostridia bacterium]|nr:peptidyl-alpha-hydroxyglycine alpha-amidating lyase family protein [Clostridia bacterium]